MENENNQVRQIPIDSIDDPKFAIRSRANESTLYALADSIRDVGLIQPILVRPRGARFEVVAGHRRLVACRIIGLLTVPCIVNDVDDTSCDTIKLHENFCREDVNIIDEAKWLERIMTAKKAGISELAKMLKRSETFIRTRLDMLKWDKRILEAVALGKIKSGTAYWFAKITDPLVRLHYLDVGIKQGISMALARDWFHRWENKGLPEPPPPQEKVLSSDEPKVEYYGEPCQFCGKPIVVGEEKILFVHPECLDALERDLPDVHPDEVKTSQKEEAE